MLTPEELMREYVREAIEDFPSGSSDHNREVISTLGRMAAADGDYSRIERACVSALAKRLA